MIRCSVKNDREGIISLWNKSFGDNREEIEFFLDNKSVTENTVVCEENGKIVSQLFLLDGQMHINGNDYPSYYLYAACTSKKHRGKGIMSKMLEFSRNLANQRGIYFICLMPAEESLYDYYSKYGYETFFERKIIKTDVDYLKKQNLSSLQSSDFSFKNPEKSRNNLLSESDYFKWDNNSIDFAFSFVKMFGGNVICDCNGYLLYSVFGQKITVKETTFTQENLADKLANLCCEYGINEVEIITPSFFNFYDFNGEIKPNGMILCIEEEYENLVKSREKAYLGLTLD